MHILCLGLNHTTTPINLREQLSLNEDDIRTSLSKFSCGYPASHLNELLILSTCNRVELYGTSTDPSFSDLEAFLAAARGIPGKAFGSFCYTLRDMEAVQHLFRVAAGLDSLVIGEPQILGQVTRALELAREQDAAGPVLNRLFQAAIHAGKRARTETHISRNPASVSSLAASVAEGSVPDIHNARVLVLGAGEMAELTVEALRKRGVESICVINRTLERAGNLAGRWQAEAAAFENLEAELSGADILISSTGAPGLVVDVEMVSRTMSLRPSRSLVMIDIALPRDIDPRVARLPHVKLIDMDGLNARMEQSLAARQSEVPHVNLILAQELVKFSSYLQQLEVLPLIAGIHQHAELIRQSEVEKTLKHLPRLSGAEIEHIEAMTQALVRKLLEAPTLRLREVAACDHGPAYTSVARNLFGLEPYEGPTELTNAAD